MRHTLFPLVVFVVLTLALPVAADDALVGHWKFEEQKQGKTPDSSGNGFHGILHGKASIVEDEQRGSVLKVGGPDTSDEMAIADLAVKHTLPEKGGATIAVWVKRNGDGSGGDAYHYIFALTGHQYEAFTLSLNADNAGRPDVPSQIYCFIEGDKPGNNKDGDQVIVAARANVPNDTWTHLAVTFDREKDVAFPYVNGKPVSQIDISSVGDGALNWAKAAVSNFGGFVDDLRYYQKPLTHKQIAEIYEQTQVKRAPR